MAGAKILNGVDIGENRIAIAQYVPQQRAVTSVVIKPFDAQRQNRREILREELKHLSSDVNLERQNAAVSLPAQFAVIKHLAIDDDERERDAVIEWNIGQHLLGSPDEYTIDYERETDVSTDGEHTYLVVAYRTSIISQISALMRHAELKPSVIDIDIFALINAFEANYPEKRSIPAYIVHCDVSMSKVVFTQNGHCIDYECFSSDREDTAMLFAGVRAAIKRLETAMGNNKDAGQGAEIFLSGPLFAETEMREAFLKEFPSSQILFPFTAIACRAEMSENDLKMYAPHLTVAVGLALRGTDIE
jgi:type IV pilus assembly protein PilM